MGGQLITAPSPDSTGPANYLLKQDFRRLDDQEIRAEGYNYFRPNTAIPLGAQPLFADGDIILVHEVKRQNGRQCVIVGTRTTLYRYFSQTGGGYFDPATYYDADYFDDNPGEWLMIGSGFSEVDKDGIPTRWQPVDLNGYVVLNNGVDLPVLYRVEESEVTPIYELRELGVASIGSMFELENYLVCLNVRQIKDADLSGVMGLLNSGATTGTQTGGVSSADVKIVGSVASGATVLTATGNIFQAGHVGKTVRFLNQFSSVIAEYYSPTSVRLASAPTSDVSALVFIITRPIISGGIGSVVLGNQIKAKWVPGDPAPFSGTAMAGQYYVLFEPNADYPFGWCSGIASVIDFQTATLVKTPPVRIALTPFVVVPSEYLLTLSGGSFAFEEEMTGQEIIYGYKKRKIIGVVDSTNALTVSDYPLIGQLSITNPDSYAVYDGAVDAYGFRVLWGLPKKPDRFGSSVEVGMSNGDNKLTLAWPMKSLKAGDEVLITGAADSGGNLLTTIRFIAGTTVVVKDLALRTVRKLVATAATTLTHSTTTATFNTAEAHGLEVGQLVTIAGAKQGAYNGAFNVVTVPTPNSFTYLMLADPGADASILADKITVSAEAGLLKLADSLTDADRFEDLEDDGSEILAGKKLRGIGVLMKETSIFLMSDSGQLNPPFAFDIVYGGSKGGDRSGALAFPNAVANVDDEFLLYPGENDFYRFDLVTRSPKIFSALHNCRNLFFDAIERGGDCFAADNGVTREIWFSFPDSTTGTKLLRFDYLFNTVSQSNQKVLAACTVNRPNCGNGNGLDLLDEKWFTVAVGTDNGSIVGYYGRTNSKVVNSGSITASQAGTTVTATGSIFRLEHVGRTIVFDTVNGSIGAQISEYVSPTVVTVERGQTITACSFIIQPACWSRFGVDYDSELRSSQIDFGIESREDRLTSYGVHLSESYIGSNGQVAHSANPKDLLPLAVKLPVGSYVVDRWHRLGFQGLTSVTGDMSYTYYQANPADPFNTSSYTTSTVSHQSATEGLVWEQDAVNGLVRILPLSTFAVIPINATFTFHFSCPATQSSFNVEMWGGLSMAKGLTQLFARQLTDLDAGFIVKTSFVKYLYQDRIKISGAFNSAKLSMRAFEIHLVNSNQIGRQSRI